MGGEEERTSVRMAKPMIWLSLICHSQHDTREGRYDGCLKLCAGSGCAQYSSSHSNGNCVSKSSSCRADGRPSHVACMRSSYHRLQNARRQSSCSNRGMCLKVRFLCAPTSSARRRPVPAIAQPAWEVVLPQRNMLASCPERYYQTKAGYKGRTLTA